MNILLVVIVSIIFLISLTIHKKNFASPCNLFVFGFLVSSIILLINTNVWNYSVSSKTIAIVATGLLCFLLGTSLPVLFHRKEYLCFQRRKNTAVINRINATNIIYLFLFIQVSALLFRIADVYFVTGSLNLFASISTYKANNSSSSLSLLLKIINPIVTFIGTTSIVYFCLTPSKKTKFYCIFLLIPYLFYYALTGTRIEILYLVVYFLVSFCLVLSFTKRKVSFRQLFFIVLLCLSFVFSFYWLGTFTGKSQAQRSVWDNISMYSASSIAALDYKLIGFTYSTSNLGTYSLAGLSNILSLVDLSPSFAMERNLEFVTLGDMVHQTNIYTCFYALIYEFNYFGAFVVLFFEGLVFELVYLKAKLSFENGSIVWIIVYVFLSGYFVVSFVAERVFSCVLTLSSFVFFVFAYLFNVFYFSKKTKRLNTNFHSVEENVSL